jgi:hypothetical protein
MAERRNPMILAKGRTKDDFTSTKPITGQPGISPRAGRFFLHRQRDDGLPRRHRPHGRRPDRVVIGMGANFQTLTVDGTKTRKDVESLFANEQAQDRYENGHIYSGGFGMATSLHFDNRTFDDIDAACAYLEQVCQKWDCARCVTFVDATFGKPHWIIGALCAS